MFQQANNCQKIHLYVISSLFWVHRMNMFTYADGAAERFKKSHA